MNKETQFLQNLSHAKMTRGEKARQRAALMMYADSNPVPEVASTPTFFSMLVTSARFPLYASLMSIIVIVSGTGALAAEGSVPGDVFYSIKIHVNEPLMSALSPSAEGQARVSAELAARRVDEVVTLASTGRLTDEKQQYLSDAFAKEVEKTKTHTEVLSSKGESDTAEAVTADFTSHLAGEAQALAAIQTPTPVKTKAFLREVLAISSRDTSDDGQDEETLSAKDAGIKVAARTLLKNASTSDATSTAKRAISRIRKEGRVPALMITASTTLSNVLETSSKIVPKTDRAIQIGEDDNADASDLDLRLGR